MTSLRIGSLFAGYGGIERAVQSVLGGELAWYSEIEPAAIRVLEHHHPEIPNLGDVSKVNWSSVEPVDVLTGGFPCQDVSLAGRRAGLTSDTRSGLWAYMVDAISALHPQLVIVENVRGLLSAEADSAMEPCPWCLGDGPRTGLRALGAVLGDLADLGFDAEWCLLPASAVGAPHRRERVFIAAANTSSGELQRRRVGGVVEGTQGTGEGEGPQRQRDRHTTVDGGESAPNSECVSGGRSRPAVSGDSEDADGFRSTQPGRRGRSAADTSGAGLEGQRRLHSASREVETAAHDRSAGIDWAGYTPAIERWGQILGRPTPAPTVLGKRGGRQLSPRFVEWMQGLPLGWVTDVPGLTRNQMLKMLGNGVCPQQCEAALRQLLPLLLVESTAKEVAAA